jgi:hypothetical protein
LIAKVGIDGFKNELLRFGELESFRIEEGQGSFKGRQFGFASFKETESAERCIDRLVLLNIYAAKQVPKSVQQRRVQQEWRNVNVLQQHEIHHYHHCQSNNSINSCNHQTYSHLVLHFQEIFHGKIDFDKKFWINQ